nr:hypothetical protein [Tanacetum cinerariifolium]
ERQEEKVAENARNKRKWESNHNGSLSQQNKGHKTEKKKRLDNTFKNNQNQRQPNKRQNTGRAYTARHGEKKHYNRAKPLCSKCNYHHDGPCAPKCHKRDCPEQKNQNHGNQIKSTKARGVVHAFGGGETEQDLNNIEDEIEAYRRKLHLKQSFMPRKDFKAITKGVHTTLKKVVSKMVDNNTNDFMKNNLPRVVAEAIKRERQNVKKETATMVAKAV